jgi:hypothetical protein
MLDFCFVQSGMHEFGDPIVHRVGVVAQGRIKRLPPSSPRETLSRGADHLACGIGAGSSGRTCQCISGNGPGHLPSSSRPIPRRNKNRSRTSRRRTPIRHWPVCCEGTVAPRCVRCSARPVPFRQGLWPVRRPSRWPQTRALIRCKSGSFSYPPVADKITPPIWFRQQS